MIVAGIDEITTLPVDWMSLELWDVEPESQGSSRVVPHVGRFPWTAQTMGDLMRAVSVTSTNKTLDKYRKQVAAEAAVQMGGKSLLVGPCGLRCVFVFKRPKYHYGTGKNSNQLKLTSPWLHTKSPDLDKLVRAIGDALTGVVFKDDSQVASIHATKEYGERDGLRVHVYSLEP